MLNPRLCAATILKEVLFEGKSLAAAIKLAAKSQQINLTKELCFGVCRYYFQLKFILSQLMSKAIKPKEAEIECLLLIGIYELNYLNTVKYAVVSEVVECTKLLKKLWATKLINAVLRNFLRKQDALVAQASQQLQSQYNHPLWLIKKLQNAYPMGWESILNANQQQAPMILRINQKQSTAANYLEKLSAQNITAVISPICDTAIILKTACDVTQLPEFAAGFCSVQDVHAQLAASFLQLAPQQIVLDACAAPGGKTAHILETEADLNNVVAVDNDPERVKLIADNLTRLHLSATVVTADATNLKSWWNETDFDRILLDAPCSATGVIRRHPDIKLLRQESDIKKLVLQQRSLLQTLWKTLKLDGLLLYVTCSILPEENSENIEWFLQQTPDAKIMPLPFPEDNNIIGLQLLPGMNQGDGFYYCLLQKTLL